MKNPWMSMWLSAANTWGNAARGHMMAEAKRNQTNMMAEMQRQAFAFWTPALAPVPVKKRRATTSRR